MLRNIDDEIISASDAEASKYIQKTKRILHPRTFVKICDEIDAQIDKVASVVGSRLPWLNTGSLLGRSSGMPHVEHEHIWDRLFEVCPKLNDPVAEKERLCTVGSFVKWRVAWRAENKQERWRVCWRATGKMDVVSGNEIHAGEYWMEGLEAPPVSVADLKKKWKP